MKRFLLWIISVALGVAVLILVDLLFQGIMSRQSPGQRPAARPTRGL